MSGRPRIGYRGGMASFNRARWSASLVLIFSGACGGGAGTGSDGGGGGAGEPAALAGITAAHNSARAAVSPPAATPIPPLTWSGTVAATAQAWADKCQFMHSGGQYGENLFASSGKSTPAAVVADWVSEDAKYNYAANSCSDVCGHYTQVVWAKSLRLGCGVTDCTSNSPFGSGSWQLWVCNYNRRGTSSARSPIRRRRRWRSR